MFLEPYIILIVLIVTMALFIWGRWRYDVVAMIALAISTLLGAVPFDKVYTGLSNPAVITVACVMIISAAITRSGVLSPIIRKIDNIAHIPTLHIGVLTLMTAVLSAFMNNAGALALMMPIAIQSSIKNNLSPSMVLMPIALGSALGGLTTMIGTPPNLLISAYRQQLTGVPFSMFDFGHAGLFVAIVGVIFITIVGWRLLPKRLRTSKKNKQMFDVEDYITEIRIPENSPLIDMSVRDAEKLSDFLVIGFIRNKKKKLIVDLNQQFKENDILIVEAAADDLQELLRVGKLELVGDQAISRDVLKNDQIDLIEAVVPQESRVAGRSSESMRLRSRYQLNLLAISREGERFKQRLNQVNLRAGDIVMLQGPSETLQNTVTRLGLLPLVQRDLQVSKNTQAYVPLLVFALAIVVAAFNLAPVEVSFGGAVLAILLFKALPLRSLYESIDWSVIILLAGMIPIGAALQSTGGTALIAHYFTKIAGQTSPVFILGLLFLVTMTISDFMNNAATTVVMAPIAVSIATAMKVNIDPFLMVVAMGASCSFLTPIGHQNNTLVMGPGGYKFFDYIRMGLPLEIIIFCVGLPLILWIWPI